MTRDVPTLPETGPPLAAPVGGPGATPRGVDPGGLVPGGVAPPPREATGPGVGQRVLGTLLLLGTSGLVSCHALMASILR